MINVRQPHRFIGVVFIAALFHSSAGAAGDEVSYQATSGVCGRLLLIDAIAKDYPSALHEMERRLAANKIPCFSKSGCRLETFEIKAADAQGLQFHGLKVLDRKTGALDSGVSVAISSDGRLFQVQWCPD